MGVRLVPFRRRVRSLAWVALPLLSLAIAACNNGNGGSGY
jgi:hypothetical protein